ncbi:MAG: ung [Parachlamydiales bacterium]|nr:ung [Parachlamydiales bacterium]
MIEVGEKEAKMEASWLERLLPEFQKPHMRRLEGFLAQEFKAGKTIYPSFPLVFNALCHTPFDAVKVVIIGQDPYHGPGQAHGLCFSVPQGVLPPPSLINIFKEITADLGISPPSHGNLIHWARQGVLLLNATLTVRDGEPRSHYGQGWEEFTDRIVQLLAARKEPLAFVLWGKSALEKWQHVSAGGQKTHHLVLTAPHPSPLSAYAGFFGCRHFSKINAFLQSVGQKPIDWV